MESTEHLTFARDGATAIVTMNRPEAKNALSLPMLVGMADAWEEIDGNDDIRCAILTGAGGTFCAGMDLKAMGGSEAEKYQHRMQADPDLHWKALLRHYDLKKPLVGPWRAAPRFSKRPTSGWPEPVPSSASSRPSAGCSHLGGRPSGCGARSPTPWPWSSS